MGLFVLAFDHRATFAKGLLSFPYPRLTAAQKKKVTALKQIVFDGFCHARDDVRVRRELAILIDEEFGAPVIRAAKRGGIPFAISTERSGQELFEFEYKSRFSAHLKKIRPTYAKALVRYDVRRKKDNALQRAQLKILSGFCKKSRMGLVLEILLTGRGPQLKQLEQTIKEMIAASIRPTVWKLEGLPTRAAWKEVRKLTRAPIIVLGRGEEEIRVEKLVEIAAQSGVTQGFAIGRTIFFEPLVAYLKKRIDRERAVREIAKNFIHFIELWHANTP